MAASGTADDVSTGTNHPDSSGPSGRGETPLETLEAEVVALASELFAVEARFLAALAEFDRRDGWAGVGMRSCAHWLNWRCGIDLHTARERVRVARRLEQLPLVAQSFARGEVSYSKVRAMTRVATPENEQVLLDLAHAGTASQVERIVRATRRADQDEELESELRFREGVAEPDPFAGALTQRYLPDGRVELRLVLDAEDAQIIIEALRAAMAAQEQVPEVADPPVRPPDACPADAPPADPAPVGADSTLPEDVPAGTSRPGQSAARGESSAPSTGRVQGPAFASSEEGRWGFADRPLSRQMRPFAERAAASMVTLAESFLASGPQARRADERYHVHVHVDADVLARCLEPDVLSRAQIEDGPALPVHTVRRIACDAAITAVVDGEDAAPVVGSPTRYIPRWMRRALKARDGGCRFPGCPERIWVDAHHIWFWADGGPTELWNLVLLCRFHHEAVHELGYRITLHPSGQVDVYTADGAAIEPAPSLPGARPTSAVRPTRQPIPHWGGERWDLGLAVAAVMSPPPSDGARDGGVVDGSDGAVAIGRCPGDRRAAG